MGDSGLVRISRCGQQAKQDQAASAPSVGVGGGSGVQDESAGAKGDQRGGDGATRGKYAANGSSAGAGAVTSAKQELDSDDDLYGSPVPRFSPHLSHAQAPGFPPHASHIPVPRFPPNLPSSLRIPGSLGTGLPSERAPKVVLGRSPLSSLSRRFACTIQITRLPSGVKCEGNRVTEGRDQLCANDSAHFPYYLLCRGR